MKSMPKTDECIKMLNAASLALTTSTYCSAGMVKEYLDMQDKISSILEYRLMPDVLVLIPDHLDKKTAMEMRKHQLKT